MAQTNLWKEGLQLFLKDLHIRDAKDQYILNDFLEDKSSPEDAIKSCEALKEDAGRKYGEVQISDEIGGAEFGDKARKFSAKWISSILGNIDSFVSVGNFAMKGAPESVGMAWFAVKLALTAIQSNYALYNLFGSGLLDLTEMMVIIRHYDLLYDERERPGFKSSDMITKLFAEVKKTYAAMLDFSFSIRKHLAGGGLAKLRHGFKDFFGAEAGKFQAKVDKIAEQKRKVLEASDGVFQAKTFDIFDELKGTVDLVKTNVQDVRDFQKTSQEFYYTQMAQFDEMMRTLNDVKAGTKPKTRWDFAVHDYEENRTRLNPLKGTSEVLASAIHRRHRGTCDWIFENRLYTAWSQVDSRAMLYLTGGGGVGKSTLLAAVWEHLDRTLDHASTILLYLSCDGPSAGEIGDDSPQSLTRIASTLMYQLYEVSYELAMADGNDALLLENCNKVFANPKQNKASEAMRQQKKDQSLPGLSEAWSSLSKEIGRNVVLIIDALDRLPEDDQVELYNSFQELVSSQGALDDVRPSIAIFAACRTGVEGAPTLDVGHFNQSDIDAKLTAELKGMLGWTEQERNEAKDYIVQRAGSDFKYVIQVAIPFIQQPFQRPISNRLRDLPEGMGETYSQAISAMPSNYLELLRTALAWTLFAPNDVKVQVIMEAYSGVYLLPYNAEQLQSAVDNEAPGAGSASDLDVKQLRKAAGPFLDIFEEDGQHLVRKFCLQRTDDEHLDVHNGDLICTRCKASLTPAKRLDFSEMEGHLDLAITCLRHLNSALFQARFCTDESVVEEAVEDGDPAATATEASGPPSPKPESTSPTDLRPVAIQMRASAGEDLTKLTPAEGHTDDEGATEMEPDTVQETEDALSDDDPAESVDDDDRADVWQDWMDDDDTATVDAASANGTHPRYEEMFWYYHVREAEAQWPLSEDRAHHPKWRALLEELDHFAFDDLRIFARWQDGLFLREEIIRTVAKPKRPIEIAALLGLTSWAEHLLARGEESLTGSDDQASPLQMASAKADSTSMLRLLLAHGSNPNEEQEYRPAAFHEWLINNPDRESVTLFLEYGADPRRVSQVGGWSGSALHFFASAGEDVEILKLLLDEGSPDGCPDINAVDEAGNTPLHILLGRRNVPTELLRAFIAHGADVNIDDKDSERPLVPASYVGDYKVLEIIIPKVTDIDDDDKYGRTALHQAAWRGRKECVQLLLQNGAQPNHVDKHNRTPLFYACWSESDDTVRLIFKLLQDKGYSIADINKATVGNRSPLRQTACRGIADVMGDLLHMLRNSPNPDDAAMVNLADTRKGRTALHCAAFWGHKDCVDILLENNAEHTLRDNAGKTALELAYAQWMLSDDMDFEDIVYSLIDRDPVAATADTELRATAAVKGSRRVLGRLHTLGADLSRADQYGWTPLMLAKQFRRTEAEHFLKQQTSWAGTGPTRWIKLPQGGTLSEDGTSILWPTGTGRVCISTDKPLPAGLPEYYFEVTSKRMTGEKQAEYPILAIGFCTLQGSAIDFPGWDPSSRAPSASSWGYHGDDGALADSSIPEADTDPERRYKPGDTVGCGVNTDENFIWFTRNGKRLEKELKDVRGRLVPLLGLWGAVQLETNFGSRPFLWKRERGPGDIASVEREAEEKDARDIAMTANGHMEEQQAAGGASGGR
ncbi:hypothetical protein LTR91_009984 [Friedmanniomyces endolithicus]|uniref:B30.2/SPRY domain-containing protein n=1 Tax=Friedmanniomyces endolithicus TaxID=329885 RepID=A0AAN6QTE8_9PEZI|nr:hypothetical protein LTR57_002699 [Friedmanniomyces endolithicus]KAK0987172.1 hypothetical protein LTR91_009984 [Friedmanniomyces endolithicus]KAK0993474.1 hypothetical protein LTS01_007417 [Friedmanniomyces endolithicus]KAK1051245.1 hypothetical protein LTS16_002710 [Friedmanniomyces endolithicus]